MDTVLIILVSFSLLFSMVSLAAIFWLILRSQDVLIKVDQRLNWVQQTVRDLGLRKFTKANFPFVPDDEFPPAITQGGYIENTNHAEVH